MKKVLFCMGGIIISYPLFYFIAYNNTFIYKIPFIIVVFISYYNLFFNFFIKLRYKPIYEFLTKLNLILTIILSILTYETFENLTFGLIEKQVNLLKKSEYKTVGKITSINYINSISLNGKKLPEYWEISYEFSDNYNHQFKGLFITKILPLKKIGDTIMVQYLEENPDVN